MHLHRSGLAASRAVVPWFLLCTAILLSWSTSAAERGFPLIAVYPAEVHKAGPQTFDVAQDPQGILYFGNLHGLLMYDGAWWRLLTLPNDQIALSVASDDRGRVALGLVNDFGYLARNANGTPEFRSLLPLLPPADSNFGDARDVCVTSAGFLFVSEMRLMLWDGRAVRVVAKNDPETGPRGCSSDGRNDVLL